jgi:hypothetical protein
MLLPMSSCLSDANLLQYLPLVESLVHTLASLRGSSNGGRSTAEDSAGPGTKAVAAGAGEAVAIGPAAELDRARGAVITAKKRGNDGVEGEEDVVCDSEALQGGGGGEGGAGWRR